MAEIFRKLLPHRLGGFLGAILAGIAIVSLLHDTYNLGLSYGIQKIIDKYAEVLKVVLGPLGPHFEMILEKLAGVRITLDPVWTHVASISGIYFLRNVYRLFVNRRFAAGIYQLFCAIPIMFLAGVGAGFFYRKGTDFLSELAVPTFPLIGIFLMAVLQGIWFATFPADRPYRTWPDFGGTWGHFVVTQTAYGAKLMIGGLALALLFTILLDGVGIQTPSVLVLISLVVSLAIYWLLVGIEIARAAAGAAWRSSNAVARTLMVLDTQAAQLAVGMFHVLLVVSSIMAVKAGEELIGL